MTNHNNVNRAALNSIIIQNAARTGKSVEDVSKDLNNWGKQFDISSETFDIEDGMDIEDFKDSLRETFTGSDEDFEAGFSIFEKVFDSDESGTFSIDELSMLGLATGDDADGYTFWRAFIHEGIKDITTTKEYKAVEEQKQADAAQAKADKKKAQIEKRVDKWIQDGYTLEQLEQNGVEKTSPAYKLFVSKTVESLLADGSQTLDTVKATYGEDSPIYKEYKKQQKAQEKAQGYTNEEYNDAKSKIINGETTIEDMALWNDGSDKDIALIVALTNDPEIISKMIEDNNITSEDELTEYLDENFLDVDLPDENVENIKLVMILVNNNIESEAELEAYITNNCGDKSEEYIQSLKDMFESLSED